MIDAIHTYSAVIDAPHEDEVAQLRALGAALDRLAIAYAETAEAPFVDGDDPPDHSAYEAMCARVRRAFPKFGYYALVDPTPDPNAEVAMGDAVDDLADIALDLEPIVWLWGQGRHGEAAWYFQLTYRQHWGTHLHDLRRYVHRCYLESLGYPT
jgi:hypothetical protein